MRLVVLFFDTEERYDNVVVNGIEYSGSMSLVAPRLDWVTAMAGTTIDFSSDSSNTGGGFIVCAIGNGVPFPPGVTLPPTEQPTTTMAPKYQHETKHP